MAGRCKMGIMRKTTLSWKEDASDLSVESLQKALLPLGLHVYRHDEDRTDGVVTVTIQDGPDVCRLPERPEDPELPDIDPGIWTRDE